MEAIQIYNSKFRNASSVVLDLRTLQYCPIYCFGVFVQIVHKAKDRHTDDQNFLTQNPVVYKKIPINALSKLTGARG